MRTFGRWAASPLGAGLLVEDGGLTVASPGAVVLARIARSTFPLAGPAGAEFMLWGDDPLTAIIGLCNAAAPLSSELGASNGVGWKLHTGQVVRNGAVIASGLPIPIKGEALGVRVLPGTPAQVQFYRDGQQVASIDVSAGGPYYFAVSIAATKARGLRCVVNAGQWQGLSPAALAGWAQAADPIPTIRVASEDYMSAASDSPANTAFAGIIATEGLSTISAVSFWMWGNESRAGSAQVRVQDAAGMLDAAALSAIRDVPVTVRQVEQGQSMAGAVPVARYVLDRIEVEDDSYKRLTFKDAHSDLDEPLSRAVFLPTHGESIAWQPQPVVIGLVRSVPTTAVNSDGSLQWICDSRLQSVMSVRDRAVELVAGTAYSLVAGGQQLSLQSPPLGPLTADVSTIGADRPATLQQALSDVFGRIGKAAWQSADALAIDQATGYAGVGYFADGNSTPREALATILGSYCADWWQDGDGVLRLARLIDPESVADANLAFELDLVELAAPLVVLPDLAPGLTRRMGYRPNAAILADGDMATGLDQVPPSVRKELSASHRGQVYATGDLPACYQHAEAAPAVESCFDSRADAQAEIDRVVKLYAVPRNFYAGRMTARPDLQLRPGQVGRIRYPRFGLAAGRKVIVTAVTSNPITGEQTLKFWGA